MCSDHSLAHLASAQASLLSPSTHYLLWPSQPNGVFAFFRSAFRSFDIFWSSGLCTFQFGHLGIFERHRPIAGLARYVVLVAVLL